MDPLWAVPVTVLVLGAAPVAYLLREVAGEVRSLRDELARAAAVGDELEALRADVHRRPPPGRDGPPR